MHPNDLRRERINPFEDSECLAADSTLIDQESEKEELISVCVVLDIWKRRYDGYDVSIRHC